MLKLRLVTVVRRITQNRQFQVIPAALEPQFLPIDTIEDNVIFAANVFHKVVDNITAHHKAVHIRATFESILITTKYHQITAFTTVELAELRDGRCNQVIISITTV
ncbi:Uncharacterised protein [Vibrio cholerae]|nr:Uncharacterised protein [Vibrio cholerae]CSA95868.1 Uncharacterised protein [Vibrio cholerae]CSB72852.1 Uncharacterised protein [Vibrio cholerae]CSC22963.1 Uncharacterised protein [Vibrio cholerae]CSC47150.1 Uncharacterised protein [Vibrio cholerae]